MNAVEIEEAISALAEQPFDVVDFPYAFLLAFGNKETTLKRLRSGTSNKSDLNGVLQTNNIHLKTCEAGTVSETLAALKFSPATTKAKAKFILATDGITLEAEDLNNGDTIACEFKDFPDHFGFFLPLAGISTVKQIRESSFDIKATGRLNRLYVELLKTNPDWGTAERRHDMNHFMARLIFLFFAEDTSILNGEDLFTATVTQMSDKDSSNTHEVISELFRAMNTKIEDRASANLPRWADTFPYVNGGLFSGSTEAPKFSKIARSYLLHIGSLDWTKINPDIFGSMIQAVADDEERCEAEAMQARWPQSHELIRDFLGSKEIISGLSRKCLWIEDTQRELAMSIPPIAERLAKVAASRAKMKSDASAQKLAGTPHRFRDCFLGEKHIVVMPAISSENRPYLPVSVVDGSQIVGHKACALYDAPLWNMALIASRLHLVWIATVCGKLETRYRYSNTMGWNTFPVPKLTEKNRADLTRCAEGILLAREAHFPATIADLYNPDKMPANLRAAHDRNDEVLERIYIGRRFRNDTERLEKLFEMYTKMTTKVSA